MIFPDSYYTASDCRGMHGFHWWLNGIRPSGERCFPDARRGGVRGCPSDVRSRP